MAETEKGSDTKPGEPSGEQLPGSEPKKSSMKAPKEDGSTSGKKAKKKKKKKKTVEDTATHDNVGKIASEDASNKDASTGSTKKSKGASNKESNAGLAKKSKGLKKSSSKEGKSDGKAAAKKGLHPKADAEKLSGSEAKDAIKKKKTKKKKKKPVASQLPSSPVVLLQPSEPTPNAISQPYLAYPPGMVPFAAQAPINQAGAPEASSGIISRLESFFGVGEQTDASQHPTAFTAAPQVTSQLQPALFPAFQGPQMPFGAPQMMPGQPAPTGEQYALTAQQTHLMPVQPNLGQQEHAQPAFAQPTLDGRTLERQTTVDQGQGQPMLVQSMPVESMQGHIAPSHSLPSQPTGGQSSLTQPAPAEFTQGEDTHWLGDYEPVSRGRRSSLWREESPEPHRRAASASRHYQPWETRCAADTTRHIKYTAAVAEDLRIASLALRRLRYDTETERRRRDFLATELMKRAALASSEVRRASMALAAMYPEPRSAPPHAVADQDSVFDAETASPEERLHRRRPKASVKETEIPVRPAAGPGGEHKAQSVASAPSKSVHEHRMTSHLVRPHRPEQDSGHSSHPMHFSFEATSSGAAAMPAARKTTPKRSLARKSSRSSLAAVSESSTDEDSGCDMCGGLWRGLVREAPTVEESSSAQDEDVLEVGGQVTGPVKWPLSCPGSRKRSSVATVTALSAVRRGSRRRPSEKPKQEVPDEHVATVLLEERQMSPLECFPGISEVLVASIAGKGDAHVETIGDNTWNQMVLDAGADGHREMHGGHAELELGNPQLEDGYCIRGMEGMQIPVEEGDYNVEAEMWKFAESTVPMFPESGVAVLFLLACLVWMGVVMFAGGAHHNLSTTRSVTDRDRTGRSRPEDVESPLPSEPAVPWTAGPPTTPRRPAASKWLVCESAQCLAEAHRLSTLLEGEPCRNFYDYACQRVDEMPPLPTPGTASSADTRLADELEDSLLAYVRDPAHSDVAVARELLGACGTGTAQDLADFVAAYVRPTWPSSGVTNDLSVWEAAGRLLRELGVATLVSMEPVVKRTSAVALGPAQLLLRPGDDAAHKQLLSDAVRDTVAFVSPSADARTVAEDVVKVLSDLSRIQDAALTRRGPIDDTLPLSNLSAGLAALVRAASSSPRLAPSTVLLLHGVDLPSLSALVTARALPVLHYVGFRAALWVAPFVATPPDKLIMAHMLTRQPPIADKQHACSRAVGHAVPLVYLRALRGSLGPLILARMWTDQLEDRFLRSLPRLLPQPGPDAHLVARSVRDTPLARFYPARLADGKGWNTHLLALAASMANTTGQRKNTLLKVRMAAAAADRSGGWALDMRPTWLPGGALRLPPGLFGSILPLNSSLHTLQMARVAVRLYTALAALLRDIPGVFDSPVRESEQTNLRSVAECLRNDLNAMPTALKSGFPPAKGQPWALFDQAVGLALAHDNLAEMLDTRRIWGKDLRLKGLEHLSSDQLFFVYYALDNCQRSDAQAQRRLSWPLGGQERVNGPLRHWAPFAEHFGCLHGQPMVAAKRCTLLADA
ncbi:hypothetical protein HPB50_016876 [Hyalomma asiaticum]|uniref:Uncharacterized protein n=1 Tax=Hyalomma asiaticum TaxID=266040 RepID=A0ACB7S710_HYAAI|nr:hypothetical protein HPB50_016876 [Hyalomma asiaticum]